MLRGNVEYLSIGNLAAKDRVSLILLDYTQRRRLEIWGRVQVIDATDNPALLSQLEMPNYRAQVERGKVITVEAWDWNCPQHITPRYTRAEVEAMVAPLQAENEALRAQIAALSASADQR